MEKKYWYYGVRMKRVIVTSTGRVIEKEDVRWHAAVYKTSDEAGDAAGKKMAKNPGLSYFCQGFDRLLNINEYGISEGFMAE